MRHHVHKLKALKWSVFDGPRLLSCRVSIYRVIWQSLDVTTDHVHAMLYSSARNVNNNIFFASALLFLPGFEHVDYNLGTMLIIRRPIATMQY